MNTAEYVDAFLVSRLTRNCSPETLKWYRIILNQFSDHSPTVPDKIETIEHFLSTRPGQDERRHGYFRALRAFYRFLSRRYDIPNPILKMDPPRRKRKLPKALTLENFVRLMHYEHAEDTQAYLQFIADTGCRIGELATLTPDSIERGANGYVCLLNGKTGERYVPISEKTYRDIIKYLPIPFKVAWLTRRISQAFKDAGVKGSAHVLRHTYASLWLGNEFSLKEILGHSNFEMLANYRHLRMNQIAEQHRQFSPLRYL